MNSTRLFQTSTTATCFYRIPSAVFKARVDRDLESITLRMPADRPARSLVSLLAGPFWVTASPLVVPGWLLRGHSGTSCVRAAVRTSGDACLNRRIRDTTNECRGPLTRDMAASKLRNGRRILLGCDANDGKPTFNVRLSDATRYADRLLLG